METQSQISEDAPREETRERRFCSHALVELTKYRWLPFSAQSGILLDISLSGLKAEMTGTCSWQVDQELSIRLPLHPLGIFESRYFRAKMKIRWVDGKRSRLGGTFLGLSEGQTDLLRKALEALSARGEAL